jgi:catechol 2,3-dioxygenase-like lactoylglutathione lyase family enzyme
MSSWRKSVGAITLFAEDIERSKSFYSNAFELEAIYEDENSAVFGFENAMINLLRSSAADALVEPAAVAASNGGSSFQLTIFVEDADAICAELAERGVELLNGPMDRAWGMRTASFADPDGHIWEVAQEIPRADGS